MAKRALRQVDHPAWVACHDTLVCAGAAQIQKWCVREGDEKGPLVAVMLTKSVAHILAASRDLLEMTRLLEASAEYQIRANRTDGDEEGARMATITLNMARNAIAKAEAR